MLYGGLAAIALLLNWTLRLPWPEGIMRVVPAAVGLCLACAAVALDVAAAVAGGGLLLGTLWVVIAAFAAAFLTQKLAIEREERHLATRFGEAGAMAPRSSWAGMP
jgi:protein-S-isoprenylcysteine O-methyltransferase Ste14